MGLVEVRDLDGPNLFLLEPAIKVECDGLDTAGLHAAVSRLQGAPEGDPFERFSTSAKAALERLHRAAGVPKPKCIVRSLDTPGHIAVAFGWSHRRAGVEIGRRLASVITGLERLDEAITAVEATADQFVVVHNDERPLMVTDAERRVPVAAITGTNGKTTTTRLLAHIAMLAGKRTGWSSSSGVYIDGQEVLTGDYSGPSGARRVLAEPGMDVAILETARGGILLRGMACESNDVSVFTNVSGDHLDLQGIRTVESLAEVKAVVCRSTCPDGLVVVNAADPIVLDATAGVRAERLLFAGDASSEPIRGHLASGGRALTIDDGIVTLRSGDRAVPIVPASAMPISFGGRARHMIENAMAAAGAAIGLGFSLDQIRSGLETFRNSPELNLGRLNVFDVEGVVVILDFAHNEAGLELLLEFAHRWTGEGGKVISIIGTAGDRTSQSLRELGRIGALHSDRVIIKETEKYGRGRTNAELNALYQQGVHAAGRPDAEIATDEIAAYELAQRDAEPGDVIAIMCQEHMEALRDRLTARGSALG